MDLKADAFSVLVGAKIWAIIAYFIIILGFKKSINAKLMHVFPDVFKGHPLFSFKDQKHELIP